MRQPASLDFDDKAGTQQREWSLQGLGVAVLVALVLAGVVGLLGHGPVAWTETASGSGRLEVASPRFTRRGGDTSMRISAGPELASSRYFRVAIDRRYVDDLGFQQVRPEPVEVESAGDRLVYVIARDRSGAGGGLWMTIELSPRGLWSTSGTVEVGGESVALHHFVFP